LDSDPASSYVPLIQNDEAGTPGYNAAALPGTATLTINAATDHSFSGIIRNQAGGAVSLIKNGPGMQEFRNLYAVQGFGYTGATTINEGTLKLNFASANSGFPRMWRWQVERPSNWKAPSTSTAPSRVPASW
jgi:hypothetical protein